MLKTANLFYHVGKKKIIEDISAEFEPGLFHVIIGPNGSGKSTFLKIFSGELNPVTGNVFYDNEEVFEIPKLRVAQRRAVMSQLPELHFPLSVHEIVMMGRYPHFNYKPGKKDKEICAAVIEKMELIDFLQRDYLTLSGGEKQRVQFARVLAQVWEAPKKGCRYIFLDEPVTSLDIHYQHQFLRIAKALTKEKIVLIAVLHDINLAIQYADRILMMNAGRVVKQGATNDVISEEIIRDIFKIDVSIINNPITQKPLLVFDNS